MANSRLSLVLTILFASTYVFCADNVPVLLWKNSEGADRIISNLDMYKSEDFKNTVSKQITSDTTVIVFLADYLRPEDLTTRTVDGVTCYTEVSKIADKSYLRAVEQPSEALNELFQNERIVEAYVTTEGELSEKIETGRKQLVVVSLRGALDGEDQVSLLISHDQVMSKIAKDFQNKGNVWFFYTGRRSAAHTRKARSAAPAVDAKATEAKQETNGPPSITPTFFTNKNFLIYYTGLIEHIGKEDHNIDITTLTVSEVTETSIHVELKGSKVITLDLAQGGGYWGVLKGSYDGKEFSTQKTIAAPLGFSYHCSPTVQIKLNGSEDYISIKGLQIEPKFGSAEIPLERYSPAQDCVGFTSAGIWAGLFVTFMLLFILTIGISWILDIRTMDRFDDPKGKTITISVTE